MKSYKFKVGDRIIYDNRLYGTIIRPSIHVPDIVMDSDPYWEVMFDDYSLSLNVDVKEEYLILIESAIDKLYAIL